MKYTKEINEETLKNRVAKDFFSGFDCTNVIKNVDFSVKIKDSAPYGGYMLWAEAKLAPTDTIKMLTQLVLTIGKAKTFGKIIPPPYLGCFDREKIAFIPYHKIDKVFTQNDFNWSVTPSDSSTREFKQVHDLIDKELSENPEHANVFNFEGDEDDIKRFISANFIAGKSGTSKIQIDKNNFVTVYNKWLKEVKPTIAIGLGWDVVKKAEIIDGDFYLADLLSKENSTLKDRLFVLLRTDRYILDRKVNLMGLEQSTSAGFNDGQKAHSQFWAKYERPPKEEYWNYIIERRDLLVPQDIRERKGSFYTPQMWVELSQKYIADVLGENWQDEYDIWDCAAGTGNLLVGLTNKYRIWASTLDQADVDVMKDRIQNGANMLESHVFQFDFLNDDLNSTKIPQGLRDIISDPEKCKKLVVYINPPYAEAGSTSKRESKTGVSNETIVHGQFTSDVGAFAKRELFAQFLFRIYSQINGCALAEFSKLKILQAPYFLKFRKVFLPRLEKMFIAPANTFDNVGGAFPIGFKVWDTSKKELFIKCVSDVYDQNGNLVGYKLLHSYDNEKFINDWLRPTWIDNRDPLGYLSCNGNDFQNQNSIIIQSAKSNETSTYHKPITKENFVKSCVYLAVRNVIHADWLNDRDQFLYPNDGWMTDIEFQCDCLTYALFNNNIQSKHGVNHWIPFTENDINARDRFSSNFVTDFIAGKINLGQTEYGDIIPMFADSKPREASKLYDHFSAEAKSVFYIGRELWAYYHRQPNCNVNASLYDIREHFQGRDAKGKMNTRSENPHYNMLMIKLRITLKALAKKIEPKVYEYGFLRGNL